MVDDDFFIGWLCDKCKNITGEPPMIFGYKEEGKERFNCHHALKKVRVYDDGARWV